MNMLNVNDIIKYHTRAIHSLWGEWLMSFGAVAMTIVFSFFVPKLWLPLLVLLMAWGLSIYVERWRSKSTLKCIRVTSVVSRALIATALIMGICLLYNRTQILASVLPRHVINPDIPYVTSLIVFPMVALMSILELVHLGDSRHCHLCKTRLGLTPQDRMTGNLFHNEARFQLKLLAAITLTISVTNWIYFFGWYSNANYNGQDQYFYLILPLVVFVLSLFYTGSRYHSFIAKLPSIYNDSFEKNASKAMMRFLVIQGDTLLLDQVCDASTDGIPTIDTPEKVEVPDSKEVSDDLARQSFENDSHLHDFYLRLAFVSRTHSRLNSKIYHYVAVIPDDKKTTEECALKGIWTNMDQITRLYNLGALSHSLSAELYRIHAITMAWKTYDSEGFRLYPVKNYMPTFRLRDFPTWNVDYNDDKWLRIASDNEDRRLFKLRRLIKQFMGFQSV